MHIVLDTNTLIRFFTNDIPKKAKQVEELLEKDDVVLRMPDVIFPELEYVLLSGYKWSRQQIIISFRYILGKRTISVSSYMEFAVSLYESSNLDMADCIIAASSLKGKLASFDKDLLTVKEVHPFWK